MTLPPGRLDYAPIVDRPIIKWPDNARVAFWVAPNMEFFEYLPENRPTQPDIPLYSRMDYGNRVGFWRMLDVLNKHKLRACCCLNLEILDHLPEIKNAMIPADWDYMAHGLYNSRPIYDLSEEQERTLQHSPARRHQVKYDGALRRILALAGTNEKPWATRPARRADVSDGLSAAVVHLGESVSLTLLNRPLAASNQSSLQCQIADMWRTSLTTALEPLAIIKPG